jgi:heme exporter protein A
LACQRGRRLLFKGLDLDLAPGRVVWLRGTNGSGKTSLLRLLAGLSQPAEGEIRWAGVPQREADAALRQQVIYIGHLNALKDDLSLLEALSFWAEFAGLAEPTRHARAALERLGLRGSAAVPVRALSQGQRRRGALARLALDDAPRCWLLDEPFDALDTQSLQTLTTLLAAHAARGGSVMMTSHQAPQVAGLDEINLEAWRVS